MNNPRITGIITGITGDEPEGYLTMNEILVLYNLLKHEYISYENEDAHKLMRKIRDIIEQHELATRDSKSA